MKRIKAIKLHQKDNVVTLTAGATAGDQICFSGEGDASLPAVEPVPGYHKVSIRPISAGGLVYKYGCVIGRAVQDIPAGGHVHVHNLASATGQGEKA